MKNIHKLRTLSRRSCTVSTTHLSDKFERFNGFLQRCNCSIEEWNIIWNHVKEFESNNEHYSHVAPWFYAQENMKRIPPPTESQNGCVDIIPGLTAKPIWDKTQFDFAKDLFIENNFIEIQNELTSLIEDQTLSNGFQPYKNANDKGASDKGHWNVFYFFLHDLIFTQNMEKFPKTIEIINKTRNYKHKLFPHCLISCLSYDSHIIAHNGPTNKKLRVYLPLLLEESLNILKVDDNMVNLKQGELVIFDDSFVHETWNKSVLKSRFVLIFDIWHPDLNEKEVDFLATIQHIFERNLLQIAKNNPGIDENNPYFAMLNVQHTDIPIEQIYSGWR